MARIFLIICLLFTIGCTSIPAKKDGVTLGKEVTPPRDYTIWQIEKAVDEVEGP